MEEQNDKLKEMLQKIQEVIELYNSLNPQNKMALTPQVVRNDVRNIFICVYNGNHVGLFKKINWSIENFYYSSCYDAGCVYVGIDSNYIGIKKTHSYDTSVSCWEPIGTKLVLRHNTYVSNCVMQDSMSFDDMRLIMYKEGKIKPYEIGKADPDEMLEVLKYAFSYYQLDQDVQAKRSK